jgi:hypothetical protein
MAIQTFTAGQVLTAAQMNELQKTVATYNAIGYRGTALVLNSSANTGIVDNTNFTGTINGAVGDLIQATWSSHVAVGTNIAHFNFYTFNVSTAVNPFITPVTFNPFFVETAYGGFVTFVGFRKLVAGDIFSNQVTVKLTANSAGTNRTVVSANIPAQFSVTNLGQVQ